MCNKSGFAQIPPISVSPGILTPSAHNNSSSKATFIKDSINTIVHVTITSGTALLIGFLILLVIVIILHRIVKSHHRVHAQRLETLASLTGYGKEHINEDKSDTCSINL